MAPHEPVAVTPTPTTTMSSGPLALPALAPHELFDPAAATVACARLTDVLNRQSAVIADLHARLGAAEGTQRRAVLAQETSVRQLDAVVGQLIAIQDRLAHLERRQLAQDTQLSELAARATAHEQRHEELQRRVAGHITTTTDSIQAMQAEMATMDLVTTLQVDQTALHDRLTVAEGRIECKLDKSELSRLDGVVAKIHAFSRTSTSLAERLDASELRHRELQSLVDGHKQHLNDCNTHIQALDNQMACKLDKQTWQAFHESEFAVKCAEWELDADATQRAINQLIHRGVTLETSMRSTDSKLRSMVGALAEDIEKSVEQLKVIADDKISRNEVTQLTSSIRKELDCKAWRDDLDSVRDAVKNLVNQMNGVAKEVQLSTRFLDWFARRGEAYEHNLQVVENQLDRLAQASAPQDRQPFGSQVRFPH